MMQRSNCRSCGAPVIWTITEKGSRMPVDAEPTANGNVELVQTGSVTPTAVVHGAGQMPLGVDELRTSHFSTCPEAEEWRRSRCDR